ncbi:hypothetical protein SAMN04489727_3658 [Amycolatopsis tolypomycina]|uniref:Uncharacterized protein n=1 Tax=Amycolatopsis tolypomycina TaxID=208445 RepID=A0A1H4SAT7_9PSEU|nr:hypothetical protein SAMN04489727_3658 [Amycolatopsis tolypomycina]
MTAVTVVNTRFPRRLGESVERPPPARSGRHDGGVARRTLHPRQVWLIGVPLNLLLAIPCAYPVALALLALQVTAGELGWAQRDPTVIDEGAGFVIGLGLVALVCTGLVVFGLNALFAFRAPKLNAPAYWIAVALLIVVPALGWLTVR